MRGRFAMGSHELRGSKLTVLYRIIVWQCPGPEMHDLQRAQLVKEWLQPTSQTGWQGTVTQHDSVSLCKQFHFSTQLPVGRQPKCADSESALYRISHDRNHSLSQLVVAERGQYFSIHLIHARSKPTVHTATHCNSLLHVQVYRVVGWVLACACNKWNTAPSIRAIPDLIYALILGQYFILTVEAHK